jgi:mRNA interferase YafQ
LSRRIEYSATFKRDLKKAEKQHRDLDLLNGVVLMIAEATPLPASYHNHLLKGKWDGFSELHLQPDWLLIYYVDDEMNLLYLGALGSHSELF